jgi:hypothetical protein
LHIYNITFLPQFQAQEMQKAQHKMCCANTLAEEVDGALRLFVAPSPMDLRLKVMLSAKAYTFPTMPPTAATCFRKASTPAKKDCPTRGQPFFGGEGETKIEFSILNTNCFAVETPFSV